MSCDFTSLGPYVLQFHSKHRNPHFSGLPRQGSKIPGKNRAFRPSAVPRSWFLGFQYYLLGRSNCVSCITEVRDGDLGSWMTGWWEAFHDRLLTPFKKGP